MTESQVANEWISRGEQRAELRLRREYLLETLRRKFPGAVPEEVTRLIQEQDSLGLLHHWFLAAMDATTFGEFMAALKS